MQFHNNKTSVGICVTVAHMFGTCIRLRQFVHECSDVPCTNMFCHESGHIFVTWTCEPKNHLFLKSFQILRKLTFYLIRAGRAHFPIINSHKMSSSSTTLCSVMPMLRPSMNTSAHENNTQPQVCRSKSLFLSISPWVKPKLWWLFKAGFHKNGLEIFVFKIYNSSISQISLTGMGSATESPVGEEQRKRAAVLDERWRNAADCTQNAWKTAGYQRTGTGERSTVFSKWVMKTSSLNNQQNFQNELADQTSNLGEQKEPGRSKWEIKAK